MFVGNSGTPKNEQRALEGVRLEALPANLGQAVDATSEIHRLEGHQDPGLARDLDQPRPSKKVVTMLAASPPCPFPNWMDIRAPSGAVISMVIQAEVRGGCSSRKAGLTRPPGLAGRDALDFRAP